MTERVGVIHELQFLQLKKWPFVLFDIKECGVNPDIEKSIIEYVMDPKEDADTIHNNLKIMETWVQTLLGEKWEVKVTDLNGKTLFPVYVIG